MDNIHEQQARLRRALEDRGIRDQRVLEAIERTRRDLLMPESVRELAYLDEAQPIGAGQTISQPYIVALMTEALELQGDEKVLEIGTGSGYQAAILARLCRRVVTIERIEALSLRAQAALGQMGFTNIEFHIGDGTLGWKPGAPYDAILVTAAGPDVPSPLYNQLRVGGRLVIPIGDGGEQMLRRIDKAASGPVITDLCAVRFVPLLGNAGWDDSTD